MHDVMSYDQIQVQGQGHNCFKAMQEESTVSPARDWFFNCARTFALNHAHFTTAGHLARV